MTFARYGIYLLQILFFSGLIGSAVVVVISFMEDGKELFGEDDEEISHQAQA
jgi:hypothetical protein